MKVQSLFAFLQFIVSDYPWIEL